MEKITLDLEFGSTDERKDFTINYATQDVGNINDINYETIVYEGKVSNIIVTNVPKDIEYEVSKFIFNCIEIEALKLHNAKLYSTLRG